MAEDSSNFHSTASANAEHVHRTSSQLRSSSRIDLREVSAQHIVSRVRVECYYLAEVLSFQSSLQLLVVDSASGIHEFFPIRSDGGHESFSERAKVYAAGNYQSYVTGSSPVQMTGQ